MWDYDIAYSGSVPNDPVRELYDHINCYYVGHLFIHDGYVNVLLFKDYDEKEIIALLQMNGLKKEHLTLS